MKTKLTLSMDTAVVAEAKEFASKNGLSLSGMLEQLLARGVKSKEHYLNWSVADWILEIMSDAPAIPPQTKQQRKAELTSILEQKHKRSKGDAAAA
jgi:hypothetical protein